MWRVGTTHPLLISDVFPGNMEDHIALQDANHKLYAFGSNGSGQLGIGHEDDVSVPTECLTNATLSAAAVCQIACGGNHTVAVFRDHTFASTGENEDGRCTGVEKRQTNVFHHPAAVNKTFISHVAATWSATFASCAGELPYATGSGNSGELGQGPGVTVMEESTQITTSLAKVGITKIRSCMGHVVVVSNDGEAWGWGKGRKGQIGSPAENTWIPRKIDGIPFHVVDAACGKDFTCFFGDPAEGEYLIMGLTGSDRFGVKRDSPSSIVGWKQVAASWGSIFVLLESGKLLAWGRNDHGQLPPPDTPPLDAIAAGSEHCLGLTKDGRVLAWGWGEHGNCGTPTDANGDVKGRWNEIRISRPVTSIFAGCATSFVEVRMGLSMQEPGGAPS